MAGYGTLVWNMPCGKAATWALMWNVCACAGADEALADNNHDKAPAER